MDYITKILKKYPDLKNDINYDIIDNHEIINIDYLIEILEGLSFSAGESHELIKVEDNIEYLLRGEYNKLVGCLHFCKLCITKTALEMDPELMCKICWGLSCNTNME